MKRASSYLPESLPPLGINREQAAALIGVGASLFDQLVHRQQMPEPRVIGGRLVWDVAEIAQAFRALPHRSTPLSVDAASAAGNPWD